MRAQLAAARAELASLNSRRLFLDGVLAFLRLEREAQPSRLAESNRRLAALELRCGLAGLSDRNLPLSLGLEALDETQKSRHVKVETGDQVRRRLGIAKR